MKCKILVKFKEAVIKDIPLEKDIVTIGRNPNNDIVLDNPAVSSFHGRLVREGDMYLIEDLGSTNGTFIGDKRVTKYPLKTNDNIIIGKYTVTYICIGQEGPNEDPTAKFIKPVAMQETMMLDTREHKAMMQKSAETNTGAVKKAEKIGGFTIVSGSTDKPEYIINEKLATIGKTDNAIIKLKGFFAPQVAALINRVKDDYFISPPGSGKKPHVNGQEIEARHQLQDGDVVDVAGISMQFFIRDK